MDRRDDLRRTLEVRFYDAQKQVKSQKPRTPDFYGYSYFLTELSQVGITRPERAEVT